MIGARLFQVSDRLNRLPERDPESPVETLQFRRFPELHAFDAVIRLLVVRRI